MDLLLHVLLLKLQANTRITHTARKKDRSSTTEQHPSMASKHYNNLNDSLARATVPDRRRQLRSCSHRGHQPTDHIAAPVSAPAVLGGGGTDSCHVMRYICKQLCLVQDRVRRAFRVSP